MCSRLLLILTLLLALFGIAACDASGYRKKSGQWAHGDTAFTPQDPASFQPLDALFARDALRGYYRGAEVPDSDGGSFAVVSETEARDRHSVYHCDTYRKGQEYWTVQHLRITRIAGADAASYVSLGQGYARDRQRVYADGVPFQVRDPASFQPLGGDYARDAQRGYHARVEIPGSHGPSFELVHADDPAYARDRQHVYHAERDAVRVLREASPDDLHVLGRGYAADARHVWHRGQLLVGADAASFVIDGSYVGPTDANDKSGAWQAGQRVQAK